MPGNTITGETRQFVVNLLEYFNKEKENKGPLLALTAVHERVADALKISLRTVTRIKSEFKRGVALTTPGVSHNVPKKKTDVSDAVKGEIRNVVYEMKAKGQHVTIKVLNLELKNRNIYDGSDTSLWRLMNNYGFSYKLENGRRLLCEKPSFVSKRLYFLRHYMKNFVSPIPLQFVYLDETWIFLKGAYKRAWQDDNMKSIRKAHENPGKPFIALHAGSNKGFLEDAGLLLSPKSRSEEIPDFMDDSFKEWVSEKLIPNLQEPSIIIMDNAPYHNTLVEELPPAYAKKVELEEWLRARNISFEDDLGRTELLSICRQSKPESAGYVIDELLQEHGHQVLRLPPHHSQYNPIELIWGICKQYYDSHLGEHARGEEAVKRVWADALAEITPAVWAYCVNHTEKLIQEDWEKILAYDEDESRVIIDFRENSDDEDSSSEEVF